MMQHLELGPTAFARKRALVALIRGGDISLAGYQVKKIYGLLSCKSGKRMHARNRVFFKDVSEAIAYGYRPCANCMREEYKLWKMQPSGS